MPARPPVPQVAWWEWIVDKLNEDTLSNENLRGLGSDAITEKLTAVAMVQLKEFCSDSCIPTKDWENLEWNALVPEMVI